MSTSLPNRVRVVATRLSLALLVPLLIACGGETPANPTPTRAPTVTPLPQAQATPRPRATATPPAAAPSAATLIDATFAKSLSENQEPVDPTEDFFPTETIYLSLEFEGRPQSGEVTAQFYWRDQQLAEASVDLADANSGVIFSIGQSTFAGFNLTHENPLPVSAQYRVEAFLDGEPLGTYPFMIIADPDAIPSFVSDAVLALGADDQYNPIDPTTEFANDEKVFLVGYGDFSQGSWLEAEWYINGLRDDASTRMLGPVAEDGEALGFSFSLLPENGWADGNHSVVLYLNDEEIGRYEFSVGGNLLAGTGSEELVIDELTPYAYDTGLFSIDVPADWELTDRSDTGRAAVTWFPTSGFGAIFVTIYADATTLTIEDLTTNGEEFVTSVFGDDPNFEILETSEQTDGSVLIAWASEPEIGGEPLQIVGLSYIEQRGDKVSLLTGVMPRDSYDELWETAFNRIVNSYRIDPNADLP
ncbi:MAG TPA: hypothetical protein PKC19_03260 [Roseiflexaceae bacterium]|nr:hypothetical protein [Roseiflexaceae bacterium]